MAEMLARAKMVPLHWEVDFTRWREKEIDAFERQLENHITHTRHLKVRGPLQMVLKRLVSSAPVLETLSLEHRHSQFTSIRDVIPVNLFNGIAPSLTSLELNTCDIFSLKSPLLKGLQTLEVRYLQTRPNLDVWLDFWGKMPKLESLVLEHATPSATPLRVISEPSRTVVIPFLTKFHIIAFARDCALALAHLVMPALTSLHVNVESFEMNGGDIRQLIPYVARNVYGPQGTELLQSILICGEERQAKVVVLTSIRTSCSIHQSPHAWCSLQVLTGILGCTMRSSTRC
jgi:hypothetical protein